MSDLRLVFVTQVQDCNKSIALVLILICNTSLAQKIDNTAFYRDVSSGKSIRIHYENDFFSSSDMYYTQGINLELYHPGLKNSFLRRVLLHLPNSKRKFGIAGEHLGFTPTSISSPTVILNDRPFAACLMAKMFSVSQDSSRKIQVSSTLSLGVIGPGAGGKQFQSAIHRWINDRQPMGWDHQIKNDLILNYNIGILKGLLNFRHFLLASKASVSAGTLHSNMRGGFILMAGIFENRWDHESIKQKKFQVYVYSEPVGSLIGYDATLQGGLLNRSSVNTISHQEISRVVFQNSSGIVVVIRKLQLEYFQTLITKEFKTGQIHRWGGVRVGVKL
jgi:lipid A 3-O-deacylase